MADPDSVGRVLILLSQAKMGRGTRPTLGWYYFWPSVLSGVMSIFAVQNSSQAGHSLASRIPSLLSLLQGVVELPWVVPSRSVNLCWVQESDFGSYFGIAMPSLLSDVFPLPLLFYFPPILWRGTVPSLALSSHSFVAGVINRSASLLLSACFGGCAVNVPCGRLKSRTPGGSCDCKTRNLASVIVWYKELRAVTYHVPPETDPS